MGVSHGGLGLVTPVLLQVRMNTNAKGSKFGGGFLQLSESVMTSTSKEWKQREFILSKFAKEKNRQDSNVQPLGGLETVGESYFIPSHREK